MRMALEQFEDHLQRNTAQFTNDENNIYCFVKEITQP